MMKALKRVTGILLGFVMCLCLTTACDKGSNDNKSVELIVKVPIMSFFSCSTDSALVSAQELAERAGKGFAAYYKKADVKISVKVFDYVDETKAITDCFDTEQATDVLFEDYFNMSSYIHTGRVVPLDDIITEEIRGDIDESAWKLSTVNNKTYMMPYLSRQNILIYNKALMRDCGLDSYVSDDGLIHNWSTEDWSYILDTLAVKLPENVYPMMMYAKNNQGDTHIMSLIRAYGSNIFDDNSDFNFESAEAVKALAWLQDGVARGWYPKHSENLEVTDNQELFENNQLVFYLINNANITLYGDLNNYGFVNFPNNVTTSFVTGFEVFDNGDEDKVKAAKAFVKYIYETDELLELSAGNIPSSKKVAQKYADKIVMLDTFLENSKNIVDFMNNSPNWQGNSTSVRSVFYPHIHDLLLGVVTPQQCAEVLDEACNRALEIGRESDTLHD